MTEAKRKESDRSAELTQRSLSAEIGAKQRLQVALDTLQRHTDREKEALFLQLQEVQEEKERLQEQADG